MTQDFIDDVLSSTSRDASIDREWREINNFKGSKADFETIFDSLSQLYWEGVEREVAGAIVALADFDEYQKLNLTVETIRKEDFSSMKLTGLLELWNPLEAWPKDIGKPKPTISSIKEAVEYNVSNLLEGEPFRKRRARSLLQALGLMDIDFVKEHRQPTFRAWGQRPQVYEKKPLLMARQCSECRHCIRSFHFYECKEGCLDNDGHQRNVTHILPTKDVPFESDFGMNDTLHTLAVSEAKEMKEPFRLCPACIVSSSHPREHLGAVRGFSKAGDKETMEFARELDIWEDQLDGRTLLSLGSIFLDRLTLSGPRFNKTSSRHFFPAGNSHCAVMYGPLMMENGMTRDPGGALMSLRNPPNFRASTPKAFMEFLAEPSHWKVHNDDEVVHNRLLSVSADRRLFQTEKPFRERRFMSSRKQISGGLFTGFCSRFRPNEEVIIERLMDSATIWAKVKKAEASQSDYRLALKTLAQLISNQIKQAFEYEIKKFLFCFADRLHKRVKLQYNRMSNNCQDFCNSMLFNGDKWDMLFEHIYPNVPADREHEENEIWPRHMISFAGKLRHPLGMLGFVAYFSEICRVNTC
jgi:hypothetical protein